MAPHSHLLLSAVTATSERVMGQGIGRVGMCSKNVSLEGSPVEAVFLLGPEGDTGPHTLARLLLKSRPVLFVT